MSSLRTLLSAGAVILAGSFVFQACGRQSEAERCETANGNNDCDPGLVCEGHAGLSDTICCPAGGISAATTDECRQPLSGGVVSDAGVDSGAVDTGTVDTGTVDTGASDTAVVDSGTAADADAGD